MVERRSEPVDAFALRSRVRTLQIGIWPSVFACVFLIAYDLWTWERPHRAVLLVLCSAALVSSMVLARAPIEPLVRGRWREPFFLAWSGSLIGLVTLGASLDGGVVSPLALAYFLPLAYAALSYPLPSMLAVAAMDLAAFLGLALLDGRASAPYVVVFAACLITAAWMCAWQAHNLDVQRRDLARVSRTDPLTGALNRRGFEERFAAALAEAQRRTRPVALVLLDLDHFKQVNDSQGHAAGDELLCWVVKTLQDELRAGDSLGRLGGDEFALMLEEDPGAARATVGRLLDVLGQRAGVSAGIAAFPLDGCGVEELHHVADLDLYERKGGGRPNVPVSRELSWAAALASCVDERMAVKHEHSCAVAGYAAAIGARRGWTDDGIGLLRLAATLHDVGKIHVSVEILRKPGRLSEEEFAEVARHPAAGAEIVARVEGLEGLAAWIRHSHERVDGAGYPDRLAGTEIPEASRIVLVADAYDAMTSDRPYRRALTPDRALQELRRHAGTQFDAECVEQLGAHLVEVGVAGELDPA